MTATRRRVDLSDVKHRIDIASCALRELQTDANRCQLPVLAEFCDRLTWRLVDLRRGLPDGLLRSCRTTTRTRRTGDERA